MDIDLTVISEFSEDLRLDKYISDELKLTRSQVSKHINSGDILVNGSEKKPSYRIKLGDRICGKLIEEVLEAAPEDIKLDIIYQDEDLMLINKSSNLVVHPSESTTSGTVVNALLGLGIPLSNVNGDLRPGIIHRLDKDTTGLLIVAKNNGAHNKLALQFSNRAVKKEYLAIIHGTPKDDSGRIDKPIGRNPRDRKKMSVVLHSQKNAITDYSVLDSNGRFSLIKLSILTGRTHQIRVHMAHLDHPIVGDQTYGKKKEKLGVYRQMLHSYSIEFVHPSTGETIRFTVDPDEEFLNLLKKLGLKL